jgi:hypothetical protein
MEEVSLGAREDYHLNELLAAFDAPAYIRRARGVETSLDLLLTQAGAQRNEWLLMVKIHLATLEAVSGGWDNACWLIANTEEMAALTRELSPRLRGKVWPNRWRMRGVTRRLNAAIDRFNQRWQAYVPSIDLTKINALREGYNRWYVLEKACALRNEAVARAGFVPLPMLSHQVIHDHYPPLPRVRLVGE